MQIPRRFAPGCDHFDVRVQGIRREFEPHLVVALAGGAVGDGAGAGLGGDFHQALGDQRPGDAGAEQVFAFVDGVGVEHRKDVVAHELLGEILDVDLGNVHRLRLGTGLLDFLALADVRRERHHFGILGCPAANGT